MRDKKRNLAYYLFDWANSPFSASYFNLWKFRLGIITETYEFSKPLFLWINDGLMAIFFFLIGLEIKREVLIGELNSVRKVAFPLFGAIGGMLVPICVFLAFNQNSETELAWGIPMATDIAFSLAILNMLGNKVPMNLKIFLTAFAIVDDLGAVMVIALFYTGTIQISMLLTAFLILGLLYFLAYKGYYSKFLLTFSGIVVWFLFLKAGVHPTLAGILMAFCVPVRQTIKTPAFMGHFEEIYRDIQDARVLSKPVLSSGQLNQLGRMEHFMVKFRSPLQSLEHNLHGWVAYFIVPIFALANAGISLKDLGEIDYVLAINITLALLLGKGFGVSLVVYIAEKLKWLVVPGDIGQRQIFGVSFLAGIGFTMAFFIANLAFKSSLYLNSAKIGILLGSGLSAMVGYCILATTKNRKAEA